MIISVSALSITDQGDLTHAFVTCVFRQLLLVRSIFITFEKRVEEIYAGDLNTPGMLAVMLAYRHLKQKNCVWDFFGNGIINAKGYHI